MFSTKLWFPKRRDFYLFLKIWTSSFKNCLIFTDYNNYTYEEKEMLILYRKCETKQRPSAQKQELEKRHSASELYHSSSALGSEGGGPHLFHDLKPCSQSHYTQLSPSAELSSRCGLLTSERREALYTAAFQPQPSPPLGSCLSAPELSQISQLHKQPTGFPRHCQHTAGNNVHPALGGLTRG